MKYIYTITLALLVSLNVSADNLSGTKLYCEPDSCGLLESNCKTSPNLRYLGFEFTNNDTVIESLYKPSTRLIDKEFQTYKYETNYDAIYMGEVKRDISFYTAERNGSFDNVVVIQRKPSLISNNLKLTFRKNYSERYRFACKVFDGSHVQFHDMLKSLYLIELNNKSKGNKI